MPIEPKLGRLVTYCERFPSLKPHEVTWKFERSIYPLSQYLWPLDLAE